MEASALTHSSAAPALRGPTPLLRLQSDERLIAMTRRGQHAAFEALCSRYQSRLLSFCRHMLGSREDAEDVLQEVFAAAFNAVLADEREINVRPWLYRIARNRSLNHLRRASAVGVDSMDVHFADHGMSTGDRAIRRESFRELLSDVHELPETQRTALLLREIDALSYEQIAQAMETTVPSVKSLLVRARISLAEAAEARKLSCAEVRLELGEVAEGLRQAERARAPPRAQLRSLPLVQEAAQGEQPRARRRAPRRTAADLQEAPARQARLGLGRQRPRRRRRRRDGRRRSRRRRSGRSRRGRRHLHRRSRRAGDQGRRRPRRRRDRRRRRRRRPDHAPPSRGALARRHSIGRTPGQRARRRRRQHASRSRVAHHRAAPAPPPSAASHAPIAKTVAARAAAPRAGDARCRCRARPSRPSPPAEPPVTQVTSESTQLPSSATADGQTPSPPAPPRRRPPSTSPHRRRPPRRPAETPPRRDHTARDHAAADERPPSSPAAKRTSVPVDRRPSGEDRRADAVRAAGRDAARTQPSLAASVRRGQRTEPASLARGWGARAARRALAERKRLQRLQQHARRGDFQRRRDLRVGRRRGQHHDVHAFALARASARRSSTSRPNIVRPAMRVVYSTL